MGETSLCRLGQEFRHYLGCCFVMKELLIRVFIWPSGAAMLVGMSMLTLLLLHLPDLAVDSQAKTPREEFPGQRRGGGTHWVNIPHSDTMA